MKRTLRAALVVTTSALAACQEKRPDEGLTHNPPMPQAVDAGPAAEPSRDVPPEPAPLIRNNPPPPRPQPDVPPPQPPRVNPPPIRRPPLPGVDGGE
jgi:type IV secretory pathway VirB10-like protein